MRLNKNELQDIKNIFIEIFKSGDIYLFGSRVDDSIRGGDIDLFVVSDSNDLFEKKIDFLVKLKQKIGDQKIDVIVSRDKNRLIEKEAINKGVKL